MADREEAMTDAYSGRVFSYSRRGQLPEDVTDKYSENNVESIFSWWDGTMACDECEIAIATVIPIASAAERDATNAWWQADTHESLFPASLNGELCPKCEKPTLRYYHIEGWYDGHPDHQAE